MRSSLLLPSAAVVLAGMAFTASSVGQSPKVDLSPAAQAKLLYDHGNALYDHDKPKEAEEAYQKAWELHRSYDIAFKLGRVELLLGQKCDVVEHLTFAYDHFPPVGKPEDKERLLEWLKKARRRVAYLEVKVDVAGAEVRVDGKPMGTSPLPGELCVEQGFRVVEAVLAGYDGEPQRSHAANGVGTRVDLHLTPRPSAGKPTTEPAGITPAGITPQSKSFFERKSASWIVIGGGFTAAGLGLGIGMTVDANSRRSRTRELQGQLVQGQCGDPQSLCDELKAELKGVDRSIDFSIGGFVVSGVAVVATAVYMVWPSSGPSVDVPAPAVALAPMVTGSAGGLMAYGQF